MIEVMVSLVVQSVPFLPGMVNAAPDLDIKRVALAVAGSMNEPTIQQR